MNDLDNIAQFTIGAVTIAADRNRAVRAEVMKVGDTVRVLEKPSYGDPKVHTGVIVGFEPFKDLPTIIVAYVETNWSAAEMKMLYFNDKNDKFELLAAPDNVNIDVERGRVLDWFASEEQKKLREIDELNTKRQYFERYFGSVMLQAAE